MCTNTMMKESILLNEICHKLSIGFIKADIYGIFANVFCDFGQGFKVLDVDGKQAGWCIVTLLCGMEDC